MMDDQEIEDTAAQFIEAMFARDESVPVHDAMADWIRDNMKQRKSEFVLSVLIKALAMMFNKSEDEGE